MLPCCAILFAKVKRGTIAVRKDPADPAEWQFALKKTVAWTEGSMKHELQGDSKAKAEAAEWMELKSQGLLQEGGDHAMGSRALDDLLERNKGREQPAIMDKAPDEGQQEAASNKDEQVKEADILSEMGGKAQQAEGKVRLQKMLNLLQQVKKKLPGSKAKSLDQCIAELKQLQKKKALKMEEVKAKLIEAALEVKKAKKI